MALETDAAGFLLGTPIGKAPSRLAESIVSESKKQGMKSNKIAQETLQETKKIAKAAQKKIPEKYLESYKKAGFNVAVVDGNVVSVPKKQRAARVMPMRGANGKFVAANPLTPDQKILKLPKWKQELASQLQNPHDIFDLLKDALSQDKSKKIVEKRVSQEQRERELQERLDQDRIDLTKEAVSDAAKGAVVHAGTTLQEVDPGARAVKEVKDLLGPLLKPFGTLLKSGWNKLFGKKDPGAIAEKTLKVQQTQESKIESIDKTLKKAFPKIAESLASFTNSEGGGSGSILGDIGSAIWSGVKYAGGAWLLKKAFFGKKGINADVGKGGAGAAKDATMAAEGVEGAEVAAGGAEATEAAAGISGFLEAMLALGALPLAAIAAAIGSIGVALKSLWNVAHGKDGSNVFSNAANKAFDYVTGSTKTIGSAAYDSFNPSPTPTGKGLNVPAKYAGIISGAENKYGLPPGLLASTAFTESKFQPNAKNPTTSAEGMFQFTKGTAAQFGLTNPRDVPASAEAAGQYYSQLLKMFGGNVEMAIAAYHDGPGAVRLALKKAQSSGTDWHKFLSAEGQAYVPKVVGGLPPSQTIASSKSMPSANASAPWSVLNPGGKVASNSATTPNYSSTFDVKNVASAPPAPAVMMPTASNSNRSPSQVINVTPQIGQNVSDRNIALLVTGGMGMPGGFS